MCYNYSVIIILVIKMERDTVEKIINVCKRNIENYSLSQKKFEEVYLKMIDKIININFSESKKNVVLSEIYKLSILGMEILPDPRVEQNKKIYIIEKLFENPDEKQIVEDIDKLKNLNNLLLNSINNHIDCLKNGNKVMF